MKKQFQYGICIGLVLSILGCEETNSRLQTGVDSLRPTCRGVYFERSSKGELKKFNQYYNPHLGRCLTDNVALSLWEISSDEWEKNRVKCVPQPRFRSRTLVSANNYYRYRNGRDFIDLDSSTGIYRRVLIGEERDGAPSFTRIQSCFYQRTGEGVDESHGSQLLLDTDIKKRKSSEHTNLAEIFRYGEGPNSLEMVRYDVSFDWDYRFCPENSTPWEYCNLLRNGDIMFYPILTRAQQEMLLNEALLIRRQFNFREIQRGDFENIWSNIEKTHRESGQVNWKYKVNILVDQPRYTDQAWREYVQGLRPRMPTLTSVEIPPICYEAQREVQIDDGSTAKINGEVCYINGEYRFIGN